MNKLIRLKLETIVEFQKKYPTSHVGGSIGLMLRGIDLQRDLSKSDLDFTIDEFDEKMKEESLEETSGNHDFDFAYRKDYGNGYVKIDLRINPEPSFDIIEFEGTNYNVSKLRDILFWKTKYANKGNQKHKEDLETIKTGVRPVYEMLDLVGDDLPF